MLKYIEKFNIRHYGMKLIGSLLNFSVTDVDGQSFHCIPSLLSSKIACL